MKSSTPLLPSEWRPLAAEMARHSSINQETAELLMCAACAAAYGNTIRVHTPEWNELGPAFDLALVSPGAPMPRGALLQALGPIPDLVKLAVDQRQAMGPGMEAVKASWETLKNELLELEQTLQKEGVALDHANSDEAVLGRIRASTFAGRQSSSLGGRYDAPAITSRISDCLKRRAEVYAGIDALLFKMHPGILVNEPAWRELPKLAENSLDQSVLALCFASGPRDIAGLDAGDRSACSRTLSRKRTGAPAIAVITSATETDYAAVLSRKHIRDSGILSGFLFIDVARGAPDSAAPLPQSEILARWHELITNRWNERIANQNHRFIPFHPDAGGFAAFVEFRKWVQREQSYSPEIAGFLSMLPDLCLQLALTCAALNAFDETRMISRFHIERVAGFLRQAGRRHRDLLDRMVAGQPAGELQEREVARVVQKLERRGPLTKRDLARSFHNQDYARFEPVLDLGIRNGKIRREGDLYRAQNVSVGASA